MNNLENLFEFYQLIENLKSTMRYSTQKKYEESTAEHSWKVCMMAIVSAKYINVEIDVEKAMKIAIIHDLPELICGDVDNTLVYDGKITADEKYQSELDAIKKVIEPLSEELKIEIYNLWTEYENSVSLEAKYIKVLDKLEALSHMLSIPGEHRRLDHTVQYADKAVSEFPEFKPLLKVFKEKLKKRFEENNLEWKEEFEDILKH